MNGQKTYGYMRESTREQNEEQQRIASLKKEDHEGCHSGNC